MIHHYQAAPDDDLIWHDLGSMMLLFHRSSGITHMLADPVPAILHVMGKEALSAPDIAARLTSGFEIEAGVDAEEIVKARLDELTALGLVTRAMV